MCVSQEIKVRSATQGLDPNVTKCGTQGTLINFRNKFWNGPSSVFGPIRKRFTLGCVKLFGIIPLKRYFKKGGFLRTYFRRGKKKKKAK